MHIISLYKKILSKSISNLINIYIRTKEIQNEWNHFFLFLLFRPFAIIIKNFLKLHICFFKCIRKKKLRINKQLIRLSLSVWVSIYKHTQVYRKNLYLQ